jgi:integral membrane protein
MNLISIFRLVAFLEGLSYILLLLVAVPIKYSSGEAFFVKMLGMPHGILFVLYIAIALVLRIDNQWIKNNFLVVLIASVIPFGTFVVDFKFKQTL